MKTITELLNDVAQAKGVLTQAQAKYDEARKELAQSPLLAEAGLQVRPDNTPKPRKPVSEETKQKMRDAWKKRQADGTKR